MVGAEVRRDESHRLIYAAGASWVGEVRIVSVSSSGHQPGAIFTNLQRHLGGADSGAALPAEQFFDPANAARLWEVSEQLVS
jgi:hypothetical protein